MKLEINMVVLDAKEAGKYYKELFNADILSTTDLDAGQNETMIKLGETKVRILDQNKDLMLFAPTPESINSFWANIYITDINDLVTRAVNLACIIISPITEFPNGAINVVFRDKYNHIWVVNQL